MERILVIDDEVDYANVVKKLLEQGGYEVILAHNGKEGLEKLREKKVDIVLLDIMMPEMDGFEVCKRIREEFKSLPVAIVSVKGDEEDIVKGIELGANDYFTKPYNKVILLTKIKSLIRSSKMERELEEYTKELEKKVEERTAELKEAHEKLKTDYWKLEKELDLAKYQMEHDELKVVFIAGLTGISTAVLLLSLIVLITTGNVYYLGLLLLTGVAAAGLIARYSQRGMKRTVNMVEDIKRDA
jgi:DNA-binding response OmpR family regulator